jgi:hypothetical protein
VAVIGFVSEERWHRKFAWLPTAVDGGGGRVWGKFYWRRLCWAPLWGTLPGGLPYFYERRSKRPAGE